MPVNIEVAGWRAPEIVVLSNANTAVHRLPPQVIARYPVEPGFFLEYGDGHVWLPLSEWAVTVEDRVLRALGEYAGKPVRVDIQRDAVRATRIYDDGQQMVATPV